MKYKILSIIICIMLLTTFFAVAKNNDHIEHKELKEETLPLIFDDDLPIWETGDSWTYNIDNVEFAIDDENLSEDFTLIFNLQIGEFTIEVADDSGDFYTTEILETALTGDYILNLDLGDGPIIITGDFEDTILTGIIEVNKADLGIAEFDIMIDGRLTVNVEEQPYIERSVFPKIPIPATITLQIGMDPPLALLNFPMEAPSAWGLPALTASIGGTIESVWLNIFNFINEKIRKWGIIGLISNLMGVSEAEFQAVSDMIDDILPVIDIEYVLSEYMGVNNSFTTPELPILFFCNNTVDLTVPAGTFYDVYKIVILGGLGTLYYSPDAENIIKMEGNFNDVIPFINNIDIELTSYE